MTSKFQSLHCKDRCLDPLPPLSLQSNFTFSMGKGKFACKDWLNPLPRLSLQCKDREFPWNVDVVPKTDLKIRTKSAVLEGTRDISKFQNLINFRFQVLQTNTALDCLHLENVAPITLPYLLGFEVHFCLRNIICTLINFSPLELAIQS